MNEGFFRKWLAAGLAAWALLQPLSIAGANLAIAFLLLGVVGCYFAERREATAARRAPKFPSLRSPLEKPLWIYWLVAALVCAAGVNWRAGLGELGKEAQMLCDFYVFSAAFALAPEASVLLPGAVAFSLASLIGLAQFRAFEHPGALSAALTRLSALGHFWVWAAPYYRAHGTIHPVTYGETMGLALLGGLSWCASERRKGRIPGMSAEIFCLLAAAGLVFSLTRGAVAGFAVGFLALLFVVGEWPRLWPEVSALAAVAAGVLLFRPGLLARLRHANFHGTTSAGIHLALWKVAWRMFKDRPLLGAGLSNYNTLFGHYHSLPFAGQPSWGNAHDIYLFQMAERGTVGLAALLLLMGTMTWQAWRRARTEKSFLALWFFSWMAAFWVMNLTESALQVGMVWMPTLALYCWMERAPSFPSSADAAERSQQG